MWRRQIFVNCWSVSDHESHALWRIYCPTGEGVALQSTFAKLRQSVSGILLYRITYEIPGSSKRNPTPIDLATKKRPMFAYEQEVRVVLCEKDVADTQPEDRGRCIAWDPETTVESVLVHPEANSSFMETVATTVKHYAPALGERVERSSMDALPPF